jgi:hypothetical protein
VYLLTLALGVRDGVCDGLGFALRLAERDALWEAECDALLEGECDAERDALRDALLEAECEAERDALREALCEAEGDLDAGGATICGWYARAARDGVGRTRPLRTIRRRRGAPKSDSSLSAAAAEKNRKGSDSVEKQRASRNPTTT